MFKYVKSLTLVTFFALALSTNAFGDKPHHYIFLIHGIGGNLSTFLKMDEVLLKDLTLKDVNTSYEVIKLAYSTGDNKKTPDDFAIEIGEKIYQEIHRTHKALHKNDKISIVAHSQGGLVSLIWLYQAALGGTAYHPELFPYMRNFITLGTPFWGSKAAVSGGVVEGILGGGIFQAFGTGELKEMSFGSAMYQAFRKNGITLARLNHIEKVFSHIQGLFIAGVNPQLKGWWIGDSGLNFPETDLAVPISSARYDFFYSTYDESSKLERNRVETGIPFVVVNAVHSLSFSEKFKWMNIPNIGDLRSMVQVSEECLQNQPCSHPTLYIVEDHLLGKKTTSINFNEPLTSFIVDTRIKTEGSVWPWDIKIDFLDLKDHTKIGWHGKTSEFMAENILPTKNIDGSYRKYFMGITSESDEQEVQVRIQVKGHQIVVVPLSIKPTYTSYLDVFVPSLKN